MLCGEKATGKMVKDPRIKLFGKTIQLPETLLLPAEEDVRGLHRTAAAYDGCSMANPQSQKSDKADEQDLIIINTATEGGAVPMKTEDLESDKSPKKPERILPCPRCNSMDTKFCYFNNYNTNQPRHFCKNCQRYWTAGGTMRNVPVGAGRRKNKSSSSSVAQFRHQMSASDSSRAVDHHPTTLLTFTSSDAPLCESLVSSLNIADNKTAVPSTLQPGDDDKSTGPVAAQVSPMPYPWHSVQWGSLVSPPPFAYPLMPFYSASPPSYLSYTVPWIISPAIPPPPSSSSGPLGKHSRDDNNSSSIQNPSGTSEKLLWVPKTLRMDDTGEGTNIWATLGTKKDGVDSVGGNRSLFKAFHQCQSKEMEQETTSTVLQANPAALSRSLSFHESS